MRKTIGWWLAAVLALTGCSDEGENGNAVTLTETSVELYSVVNCSNTVAMTSTGKWTARCSAGWLTFSPSSGEAGTHVITLSTTETNRTKAPRTAQLEVKAGNSRKVITVRQRDEYAVFDMEEVTMAAEGGTLDNLTFKTNVQPDDLVLYGSSDISEWITFIPATKALSRSVQTLRINPLTVKPNTGKSAREGAFIITMLDKNGEPLGLDTLWIHQDGRSSDYRSSDYSADGRVTRLSRHTVGNGIPVVLMGDAFVDTEVADGTYMKVMKKTMENLFSEEPVKSLREYFDVYAVTVISSQDTPGSDYSTALSTVPHIGDTGIDADEDRVLDYVKKVEGINRSNALVVVILNTSLYKGVTYLYGLTDYAIAFCPVIGYLESEDFREVLVHEAIGHGLAKLADEYVNSQYGSATEQDIDALKDRQKRWGWMLNVDSEQAPDKVLWHQFLADSRYDSEQLGVYEGGYNFYKGIFRPSEKSMMNDNMSPFNAPSRQAIYYKVMKLALDQEPTYEEFTAFDQAHQPAQWDYSTLTRQGGGRSVRMQLAPPRIITRR